MVLSIILIKGEGKIKFMMMIGILIKCEGKMKFMMIEILIKGEGKMKFMMVIEINELEKDEEAKLTRGHEKHVKYSLNMYSVEEKTMIDHEWVCGPKMKVTLHPRLMWNI